MTQQSKVYLYEFLLSFVLTVLIDGILIYCFINYTHPGQYFLGSTTLLNALTISLFLYILKAKKTVKIQNGK